MAQSLYIGIGSSILGRLAHISLTPDVRRWVVLVLAILAPILIVATYLGLQPVGSANRYLRLVLTADLIYILTVATFVVARFVRIIAARRAQSAGSHLHLRLTALFASVALIPTVLVAVFAALTLSSALDGWFADPIRDAVDASAAAAQAYQAQQRNGLIQDTNLLARAVSLEKQRRFLDNADVQGLLTRFTGQLAARHERGVRGQQPWPVAGARAAKLPV